MKCFISSFNLFGFLFQPLEFSCPLSARLKRLLIYVIFPWWKYLCAVIKTVFDLFNKLNRPISLSISLSDPSYILNKHFLIRKLLFAKQLALLSTPIPDSQYILSKILTQMPNKTFWGCIASAALHPFCLQAKEMPSGDGVLGNEVM